MFYLIIPDILASRRVLVLPLRQKYHCRLLFSEWLPSPDFHNSVSGRNTGTWLVKQPCLPLRVAGTLLQKGVAFYLFILFVND